MSDVRIVSATVGPMPKQLGDPMPRVVVTLDDGQEVELFSFYPDEIQFTPLDFIGCTIEQAKELKFIKDRRYLRS